MNVPFDRLYTFLQSVCNHDDVLIYRWNPPGSRKLEHCTPLIPRPKKLQDRWTSRYLVCHDQEPLCFDSWPRPSMAQPDVNVPYSCLMSVLRTDWTVWDKVMLCHSELNSTELTKFEQDGAIGVFWWSHAIIARDWFRYAKIDSALQQATYPQKLFLIYNRAWSGSREYRLRFMDRVICTQLLKHCKTSMNFVDQVHYSQHKFANPKLAVHRLDFEHHLEKNNVPSSASADYCSLDYQNCAIEIVLETLFDDNRIYLTEKVLRPIACRQPFMVLAPQHTLKFLRSRGFRTFEHLWDESYDDLADPVARMEAVLHNMQQIADLSASKLELLLAQCQDIVDHNHHWFFSEQFSENVVSEFKNNFDCALQQMQKHCQAVHLKKFVSRGLSKVSPADIESVWHWLQQQNNK
jgi:hypothetical protein